MEKRWIFAFMLILIFLIFGCTGKKDVKKALEEIRTGTEGIVISFLPNAPPDKIHVEEKDKNEMEVVIELRNKGAYPQPNEGYAGKGSAPLQGRVYLGGYDPKIIEFKSNFFDLNDKNLEGKSTNNPNGGYDLVTFEGNIIFANLNVDKYEPILLATACYSYYTIAGPTVCIDPNPYSTVKEKKVCQVQDITLSSQGAPVAVTKIDEEAFATKTQFKITIKNVGGGDVVKTTAFDKCGPIGEKLTREDIDKVFVQEVKIGNEKLPCSPFVDVTSKGFNGHVRLINGEGFIICELHQSKYGDKKTAYTTPLTVWLNYNYRNTAEKKVQIKKEISTSIGEIGEIPQVPSTISQPSEPSTPIIVET